MFVPLAVVFLLLAVLAWRFGRLVLALVLTFVTGVLAAGGAAGQIASNVAHTGADMVQQGSRR